MLSAFEFFEPDVAAVAVALAAVCGHVRIKREKVRKREKEKRISFFLKDSNLRKREACDWKEGRKEGNEIREGTRGQVDMDGWIRVDGHMGEHFGGTGGR